MNREEWVNVAEEIGFAHAGLAAIDTLNTRIEVRDMCAVDKCNAYAKTWTCPPGCGTIEDCEARMKAFDFGILAQVTAEMEDEMDFESWMDAMADMKEFAGVFLARLREAYPDVLALTSAGCDICAKCTYPDAPCRFPEKAFSAMEGYGLLVSEVCQKNDLPYYYGKNTVTYTSLFLVKEA